MFMIINIYKKIMIVNFLNIFLILLLSSCSEKDLDVQAITTASRDSLLRVDSLNRIDSLRKLSPSHQVDSLEFRKY